MSKQYRIQMQITALPTNLFNAVTRLCHVYEVVAIGDITQCGFQ